MIFTRISSTVFLVNIYYASLQFLLFFNASRLSTRLPSLIIISVLLLLSVPYFSHLFSFSLNILIFSPLFYLSYPFFCMHPFFPIFAIRFLLFSVFLTIDILIFEPRSNLTNIQKIQMKPIVEDDEIVRINVGGVKFTTLRVRSKVILMINVMHIFRVHFCAIRIRFWRE